jgi:hypothetical protein
LAGWWDQTPLLGSNPDNPEVHSRKKGKACSAWYDQPLSKNSDRSAVSCLSGNRASTKKEQEQTEDQPRAASSRSAAATQIVRLLAVERKLADWQSFPANFHLWSQK